MLLFIGIRSLFALVNKRFNTSHVTLYRIWSAQRRCAAEVSIHLMLLFIKDIQNRSGQATLVSIHLMLLFIMMEYQYCMQECNVSIHLMLLFIMQLTLILCKILRFQYISCYSLSYSWRRSHHTGRYVSIHLMLLFIPHFIGFSSSNSFYNTAKYKGLQDFYQPTYHFLFTHQNLI